MDQQPLVSILIPVTGNPIYLELALTSVLLQTYTNFEIIIRDSTPTDKIQILLEKEFIPYSNRIRYIKDTRYMSKLEILQELLRVSNGTYINFMLETDLFYPTKIEKMMGCFLEDVTNSVKLVTSNTEFIDMHGNVISNVDKVHNTDMRWDNPLGSNIILRNTKYIGGLSAPLFRKQDFATSFGTFAGHQFIKEIEIASWLTLVSQGALIFLAEELTFERKARDYQNHKITLDLIVDWVNIIKLTKQHNGIITKSTEGIIRKKILSWMDVLLTKSQHILTIIEREKIYQYKEWLLEITES
ncbi:glycosyltransferase family 2 protein [Bacillus mycoides]|uniref:glycosyltransferase family 2 protein n=1 Tax=Bacillus mycoides TaxID=1405 RepID=UPI002112399A|nr:glycosyltransferase family A protein [Bacillus mycoides]MCQ6530777.1 glycosyltransferase family 2 protein [Bacillus mycoides]